MIDQKFAVGDEVTATPKNDDFACEFRGLVVGFKGELVQVRDLDDNVFDCDADQLSTE